MFEWPATTATAPAGSARIAATSCPGAPAGSTVISSPIAAASGPSVACVRRNSLANRCVTPARASSPASASARASPAGLNPGSRGSSLAFSPWRTKIAVASETVTSGLAVAAGAAGSVAAGLHPGPVSDSRHTTPGRAKLRRSGARATMVCTSDFPPAASVSPVLGGRREFAPSPASKSPTPAPGNVPTGSAARGQWPAGDLSMRRTNWTNWVCLAAVAACGDNGTNTGTATQTTTTTTASTTATTPGTTDNPTTAGVPTTSEGSGSGTDSTATATSSPTTSTSTTGTTTGTSAVTATSTGTGVDTSGSSAASDSDSSSGGPKRDMGEPVCPPDQTPSTFDFIWIANSTQGTVSKINTMTGVEVGRYRTAPQGAEPSRTSVNQYGDVAVSNRNPGGITKISAVLARCVDTNGNGMIDTSTGPNDIRDWGQDECVLWHTPAPSPGYSYGPRPTAWEGVQQNLQTCEIPVPRLWSGWMDNQNVAHFWRLHGDTGEVLDEVTKPGWFGSGYGPYGGAVNSEGDLYAIGLETTLIHIDSQTLQITDIPVPAGLASYGVAVDKNNNVWIGSYGNNSMLHYNVQEQQWYPLGNGGGWVLGLMTDKLGRVWGAGSQPCRLVHADIDTVQYVDAAVPLPGCSQPWGASIDNEGYVWIVDKANQAFKIDPDTYQVQLVVTGLVNPYTYSDMTGQGLQLVLPQ